ncbi:rab-GTPase-TBC domain-containing protein [Phlyctochytrium arcticum]|nr:rab-GTPase-TBC domain-containing protein [Phlyctochytrium arcticum]
MTSSRKNSSGALDEYGFFRDAKIRSTSSNSLPLNSSQKRKFRKREQQWLKILESGDIKNRKKIKKLGRAGIPESLRAKVWCELAHVKEITQPGLFQQLLAEGNSPLFEVIDRDIARCFPDHSMFAEEDGPGQTNLRNVLRAYAVYNPEIGYCQGMGMLAGMMLMHMPAEETFWLLVSTLDTHLKGFFAPNLFQLRIDAAVFEGLLHRTSSRLAKHLERQDVHPLMYVTQWFLTVFTTSIPWETTLWVWDMMFCEGVKPLFRIGLGILEMFRNELLKSCPTNAEILNLLLHVPPDRLDHRLVAASLKVKIRNKEIKNLRADISAMELPERGIVRHKPVKQ